MKQNTPPRRYFIFFIFIILFNYLILFILEIYLTQKYPIDHDTATKEGKKVLLDQNVYLKNYYNPKINLVVAPFYYLIEDFYINLSNDYKVLPLSLTPNKTYLKCNEGYGTELIQTDRYGFENEDKIWDEKNIDILIIGDSYAAGYCVKREDTISSKLNKYYSTLNLSLAGNSPIIYSSIFKNFSPIKKFSNIVIIFSANDNIYEKNNSYDKRYIINDNKILLNINNSYLFDEKYLNFLYIAESYEKKFFFQNTKRGPTYLRFIKYLKLKRIRYFFSFFIYKLFYEIPYSSQLIIDLVEKYCKINNCKSFYVYVPSDNTKRKIYFNQSYIEDLDKYINKMYNKNLINTSEEIYSDVKENFADKGHHLSPRGYNIISDRILKKISENNN